MSWFEEHLNWTWVLGHWIPLFAVALIGALVALFARFVVHFHMSESLGEVIAIIITIFYSIFIILLSLWVLWCKNRSLWWFFILFVPFYIGVIIFLCLENRSDERRSPPEDQSPIEQKLFPPKSTTIDF